MEYNTLHYIGSPDYSEKQAQEMGLEYGAWYISPNPASLREFVKISEKMGKALSASGFDFE